MPAFPHKTITARSQLDAIHDFQTLTCIQHTDTNMECNKISTVYFISSFLFPIPSLHNGLTWKYDKNTDHSLENVKQLT